MAASFVFPRIPSPASASRSLQRGLVALVLGCCACVAAQAEDARALLARLHDAAIHGNYEGTLVFSAGYSVSSSRVAYFRAGADQYERIEWLGGEQRRTYRRNDEVMTVWPAKRMAVVQRRDRQATFPALLQSRDFRVEDHYLVELIGKERVAGHEAQVLWLKPRDGSRFGQRWWAEMGSGLLLRADIVAEDGRVLESAAFSDVVIGARPRIDIITAEIKRSQGWKIFRPSVQTTTLDAEGWRLQPMATGFRKVNCVKRDLDPQQATAARGGTVTQTVYSDGLTHISLFIEPVPPSGPVHEMLRTSVGATHTVMRDRDGFRVTAVGDVPYATLDSFIAQLERLR